MDANLNQAPVTNTISPAKQRGEIPVWRKDRTDQLQAFSKEPAQPFIFDLNDQHLKQENQLRVTKRLSPQSYIVNHVELRREFMLQHIDSEENIDKWIKLPTHSNIVTAFSQQELSHFDPKVKEGEKKSIAKKGELRVKSKFQLVEPSNNGGMYGFVGDLGQELTERITLRNRVQKERAELEVVSYLISKPPKTKESVDRKQLQKNKKSPATAEEEYVDEGWSRYEGQKPKFKMNLDNEDVLREYTKFIYDVAIQISTGLEHAHSYKVYHGLLDTSKIIVHRILTLNEKAEQERQRMYEAKRQRGEMIQEGEDEPKIIEPLYHYKITGFAPNQAMKEAFGTEAEKEKPPLPKWEFLYKKADLKEEDKEELLMLKDIYTLGVCILELMIGRFGTHRHLLTIDMLPSQWANQPASQPLIDVIEDCLNLGQNSTREGLLKKFRFELLDNYKRFFWRPEEAYKNEFPFVGSVSNVHNKLGVMQIFKMSEGANQSDIFLEALKEFRQARKLQKTNMNATYNENLLKFIWPFNQDYQISPEQFHADLEQCEGGYNGSMLQYFTQARLGWPKDAIQELQAFRNEVNGTTAYEEAKVEAAQKKPPTTLKKQKQSSVQNQREREVDQMIEYIQDHNDHFIQTEMFDRKNEDGFKEGSILQSLSFTRDSKHLVATQKGLVSVYSLNSWQPMTLSIQVPLNGGDLPSLATANKAIDIVAVFSETTKTLVIWQISQDTKEPRQKSTVKIDLGNANSYKPSDIYFSDDELKLNLYFVESRRQAACLVEYEITDGKITQTQHGKDQLFADRKIGSGFVKPAFKDTFNSQITKEVSDLISVPLLESEFFARLQTTEPQGLYIYSNKRRRNNRYYQWNSSTDKAFSLSSEGNMIAYAQQDCIHVESVRLPVLPVTDLFDKFTKFRFVSANDQVKNVDNLKGKKTTQQRILRDIQNYKIFEQARKVVEKKFLDGKKDISNKLVQSSIKKQIEVLGESLTQGMTQNLIVELMILKYNKMVEKPSTMKNNKEFLIMQKIIMDESQKEFDVDKAEQDFIWDKYAMNKFKATKRIAIYDRELPKGQVKMVQMSSRPTKNFMLVMIEGKIYKYDLATKLLVFQFEALDQPDDMILYEDDNKLCIYNKDEVQLWDFDGEGESLPYLFEDEFFEVKDKLIDGRYQSLDKVYINENCEKFNDDKRSRMFLLDFQQCFRIYKGSRFDNEYIEVDNLSEEGDDVQVTAVQFSSDSSMIYVGDSKGRVLYINTTDGKSIQSPTILFNLLNAQEQSGISYPDRDLAVTFMMRFWLYQKDKSEAKNHFLVILGDNKPFLFDKPGQKLISINFGEDEENKRLGKKFMEDEEFRICNAQVALNSQFFIVGWSKNKKKASEINRTVISNHKGNAMNISLQVPNSRTNQSEIQMLKSGPFSPRLSTAGSRMRRFDSNMKSGLGIWKIDKDDQTLTFVQWVTEVDFVNFSVDDHCATITYWTRQNNSLDFHYLLWDFLVTGVDPKEMETLKLTDAEQHNPETQNKGKNDDTKVEGPHSDEEDEPVPLSELKKMKNMQATCCTIF